MTTALVLVGLVLVPASILVSVWLSRRRRSARAEARREHRLKRQKEWTDATRGVSGRASVPRKEINFAGKNRYELD